MTPRRRGILVTSLSSVATLVVGLSVALAASMSAKPIQGPRDDGTGIQTLITVSGDLLDSGTATWSAPRAYWDTPDPKNPDPAYEIPVPRTAVVNADGTFSFSVRVPLYDANGIPVRPGSHVITVCSITGSLAAVRVCVSAGFNVLAGVAVLSKSSGRQGDAVTVTGSRWVPGTAREAIRITWAPAGANLDLILAYPGSSAWSYTINVPNVAAGTYGVRICNVPNVGGSVCAAGDTLVKAFTILNPNLTLSRSSGGTGVAFNFSGDTFRASRPLHVYFGPQGKPLTDPSVREIGPAGAATSTNGTFGPFSYSPSQGAGNYTVTACTFAPRVSSCDPYDTATKPYTITAPTPSPSPTPSPMPRPTPTPTPSPSPTPRLTPTPTPTPTPSPSPMPSPTPRPSSSPTPTPTASASPSPIASPSPSPSATPTASLTASLAASPIASPAASPIASPAASPNPTGAATPSPAPTAPPSSSLTAPPANAPTETASPAPSPTPASVMSWPEHLRSPGQTGGAIDLTTLGSISLLALLIAFLVPFPGTLFNKTVEANYEEIRGWIAGARRRWNALLDTLAVGPLGGLRRRVSKQIHGRFGVLVFLALSALVYGFLSPTFGLDFDSLALFLGLLVGLAMITAAFDLPLRLFHGRTTREHDEGVLRALWWTLLVAIICVVVSRLANFQPGYLYGLVVSIVFVTEISTRDEGIGTWFASVWLIVLSFVSWVLLSFVRQGAFDPWLALFLQTVLVTFVVAGIETLAIGLLPMRFLPGHPLFAWRRSLWFVVFALSVLGYLLILVDPANGYLSEDSRTPMIVGVVFLLIFGTVSIGTWAYFRFRPARAGGDRPGEAPAE